MPLFPRVSKKKGKRTIVASPTTMYRQMIKSLYIFRNEIYGDPRLYTLLKKEEAHISQYSIEEEWLLNNIGSQRIHKRSLFDCQAENTQTCRLNSGHWQRCDKTRSTYGIQDTRIFAWPTRLFLFSSSTISMFLTIQRLQHCWKASLKTSADYPGKIDPASPKNVDKYNDGKPYTRMI